jgi:A/G-specific adenine glycosylase
MIQTKLFSQPNIANHAAHAQECYDLYQSQGLSEKTIKHFQDTIYNHYHLYGRQFAWRININPYHVMVSEVMLQQTQTDRVAQKFDLFIAHFPDFKSFAQAPFDEVLKIWKGLGYNRRAMNLQKMAQRIVAECDGQLPTCLSKLQRYWQSNCSFNLRFCFQPTNRVY